MARTYSDNYSSNKLEKPLVINNNEEMTRTNSNKKNQAESSESTHSSMSRSNDDDARRSKVATSMRKFLSDDDDFDYLGNLNSRHSTTSKKSRNPTSYRKNGRTSEGSRSGRSSISRSSKPASVRSKPRSVRSKPKSIRKKTTPDVYEGSLNDAKPKESSTKNLINSARRLLDKAARAASPGRLRNNRSQSPGPNKVRNNVLRRDRSQSPGPQQTRQNMKGSNTSSPKSSKTDELTASPSSPVSRKKDRSKSPGRMKGREVRRESRDSTSDEKPRSSRSTKRRSESPGRMKGRSKSPGKMKKRSQSPGALRRTDRPRRRPENRDEADPSQRRSKSSGPMSKSGRARSRRDAMPRKPSRSTRSSEGHMGDAPLQKDNSYSDRQNDLNRYKVKRNKSMDTAMAMQARKNAQELAEDEDRRGPRRAESMMLSREMGRRGKSNSLADLVQYKEEEIHSTSYFASNHVLINRERMKRGLRPLTRNVAMDLLARKSAESMAESNGLKALPTTYVGNVLRGETIRTIHRSTMLQKQGRERANILNPYFQDFGVGTCKGSDGMLYMCQLFSERLELALTDTIADNGNNSD